MITDSNGKLVFLGEVINTGEDIIYVLALIISFTDSAGEVLGSCNAYPVSGRIVQSPQTRYNYYALAPGETAAFSSRAGISPQDIEKFTANYSFSIGEMGKSIVSPKGILKITDSELFSTSPNNPAGATVGLKFSVQVEGTDPIYGPDASVAFKADDKVVAFGSVDLSPYAWNVFYPGDQLLDVSVSSGLPWIEYSKMEYEVFPTWQMIDTTQKKRKADASDDVTTHGDLVEGADIQHICYFKYIDEKEWHLCEEPAMEEQN
ncbi:MAG: hypothetical protein JEZ02_00300 [Desulfatibacillum sp.]|nr:hypothetical protein [Desulfatibacillum sp.]